MRWGWFLAGIWVGVSLVPAIDALTPVRETAAYRGWTGLAPFTDVTVEAMHRDGDALTIMGGMVKRRCEFVSLSAYVLRNDIWSRAWTDTAGEDTSRPGGDRPPGTQSWGPWSIRVVPPDPAPDAWRIWAHHRCPEDGGSVQSNLFAAGQWPMKGESP